ncbi:cytochrome c [Altererythrobacter sp. BO-6]|uniref:c-type cytochrome n=1 Tax=Altererythrobacter sp. BO-6 TaxID=2604537 RepID=UPI0013E171B1|nr:c-type cytochrome [Altererythrobacter sp. BO-6]QIG54166.1 cytochrome c [Altererythrobacter sp. BO-6]
MKNTAFILAVALAASGCAYSAPGTGLTESAAPRTEAEHHRLAFVQAACGGCHSVEATGLSPNPLSPPFADIANRQGLTRATLVTWLTDAHNYPEVMDFDLDPPQVEDIADYILTLRGEDYRKLPD